MAAWPPSSSPPQHVLVPTLISMCLVFVIAASAKSTNPPKPATRYEGFPLRAAYDIRHAWRKVLGPLEVLKSSFGDEIYEKGPDWVTLVVSLVLCLLILLAVRKMRQSEFGEEDIIQEPGKSRQPKATWWSSWRVNPELEAEMTDPGLLRKYSTFKSYTTSRATYDSVRTFYRPHSQADKLPSEPSPLPLLVFVHGLGGSMAQFSPILTSLVNVAPCLGIDFPGCGRSKFSIKSWAAYTPEALAELLAVVVKEYCEKIEKQGIIFIGHSMGCSLSALVATTHFRPGSAEGPGVLGVEVLGLIGICPQSEPYTGKKLRLFSVLLWIPTLIFDMYRVFDRRKGLESASIAQFVGKGADVELRQAQMRFNRQSRTPVFRRMAWGALPRCFGSRTVNRGLPGLQVWAKVKVPLLLVAGEGDVVTKSDQVVKIGQALGKMPGPTGLTSSSHDYSDHPLEGNRPDSASQTETTVLDQTENDGSKPSSPFSKRRLVLKTCILPAPAAHALLYDPSTYRILSGLIQTFLSEHVDTRLSLGWQLQHLCIEGKWDVKNFVKWQAIQPVSEPIAGVFRALKTLREIDDVHSPEKFVQEWKGRIRAVVDISHESPVYDPKGLDLGGIEYHKFPTVSKIPPTTDEVREFIKLIDRLRQSSKNSSDPTNPPPSNSRNQPSRELSRGSNPKPELLTEPRNLIGVHCHYGFNRTGFFIACYLIEREGYSVQAAIDEFAAARPKGIKHAHFLDQLFVRYCVGLRRAPTM